MCSSDLVDDVLDAERFRRAERRSEPLQPRLDLRELRGGVGRVVDLAPVRDRRRQGVDVDLAGLGPLLELHLQVLDVALLLLGEHLEHPNGLLVVGQTLYVGGWGSGFNPNDFSTNVLGRFFSVNLQTKKKTLITPNPTGHLDGIESDGEDGFIVTDWVNGKVLHITKTGTVSLLQQHQQGAADHAYITSRDILLLPHMLNNTLTAFKMGPFPK